MTHSKKIAHSTLIQLASKVIDTALALVAFGIITRYLGQTGFGYYTTISSYLQFFGIIADFGLYLIMIQMVSEVGRDEQKNFNNIFTLRIVTLLVFLLPAVPIAFLFPFPPIVRIGVALFLISTFLNSIIQLFKGLFQVHYRTDIPFWGELIGRLALIALLIIIRIWDQGLVAILIAIAVNNCIPAFFLFFYTQKHFFRIQLAWDWPIWKEALHRCWPIALSIILNLIYLRTDVLILSLIKSPEEVGLYGAAYRVVDVLVSFPKLFMGVMLSNFARTWSERDMSAFANYFQRSFEVITIIAVPIVVGGIFLSSPIMALIAGSSFRHAGGVLAILCLGVSFVYFSALFGNLINIIGKQYIMIFGYLTAAVVGLSSYALLIPQYSFWGAGLGTVLSEGTVLVISAIIFIRTTGVVPHFGIMGKVCIASAGMTLLLTAIHTFSLLISIPLSIATYVTILYLLGGIPKEVREWLPCQKNSSATLTPDLH